MPANDVENQWRIFGGGGGGGGVDTESVTIRAISLLHWHDAAA